MKIRNQRPWSLTLAAPQHDRQDLVEPGAVLELGPHEDTLALSLLEQPDTWTPADDATAAALEAHLIGLAAAPVEADPVEEREPELVQLPETTAVTSNTPIPDTADPAEAQE